MSKATLIVDFSSRAQQCFETTGNPAFAWHELGQRIAAKEPIPQWILDYLLSCAQRMFDPGTNNTEDTRKALPAIFGFPAAMGRGGPLSAINDLGKREPFAMAFASAILNGEAPSAARDTAFNQLDYDGDPDDKTLRVWLKAFFEVKQFPTSNQGWRLVVVPWLINHPQYSSRYPNLPNLNSLLSAHRALFPGIRTIQLRDTDATRKSV
jgi:hypothetical protein